MVLSRRDIVAREFGPWEMEERGPDADSAALMTRINTLLAGADASTRATFDGLARLHRAA